MVCKTSEDILRERHEQMTKAIEKATKKRIAANSSGNGFDCYIDGKLTVINADKETALKWYNS